MPTISRLTGRFSSVLLPIILAMLLAPAAAIGQGPTLCHISDTVYRADGTPAQGTALISWLAFTTAAGQAVTPGSLTVTLGPSGAFDASLAPNTGASPAGTYYRAIFKLDDGTTDSEYWVVPNASTTTIGAIRSKLVPASQAAQFLTRDYADSTYVSLASTQTITGVKTFSNSPAVPTPQHPTDAANKAYVDASGGGGNLSSPPPIGNTTPNTGNFTTLTAQNINGVANPGNFPQPDSCARINAAIAALPAMGGTVDARAFSGAQSCATILTIDRPVILLLGAAQFTLGGDPGISITSPGVSIVGAGWARQSATTVTKLISGGPYPLIQDVANNADGIIVKDLELDGASNLGLIGVFDPLPANFRISNLYVHGFSLYGLYMRGNLSSVHDTSVRLNGGTGILWGFDGVIDGATETGSNAGVGLQVINQSNRFTDLQADFNGSYGVYFDGRALPDWSSGTVEVLGNAIQPASGNPGGLHYVVIATSGDAKTGLTPPVWNQSTGVTLTDNHVTWLVLNETGVKALNNTLTGGYIDDNGTEEIRIEGSPSNWALDDLVSGTYISHASNSGLPGLGVHVLYGTNISLSGITWFGSGVNQQNDNGGILIENSALINVTNYASHLSHKQALKIVASNYIVVDSVLSDATADSSTAPDDSYAVVVDSASNSIKLANIHVVDVRSPQYSKGINNLGSYTQLSGYQSTIVTANPDNLASAAGYSSDNVRGDLTLFSPDFIKFTGPTWTNTYTVDNFGFHGPAFYIAASSEGIADDGSNKLAIVGGSSGLRFLNSAKSATWGTIDDSTSTFQWSGPLSYQSIPGVQYLVSHYPSIQAALNAAYNGGAVLGTVIDDRTSPYTGPGFILYDSVTLKLAAITYTINSTVTYNNGNNVVTAGIIALPGARLIGASTSSNHGTIITAANALNADLIATSTVGTGIAAAAQWWHWGGFQDLRVTGNGANQTAGNCFNIENMGETAFLRTIEVSGCHLDNILFTGASATASDIANITTNSAGRYGFNFNNLSGVAVVHGLSGDSNTTSIVRLNGGQSGTLTILGFKTEEEISGQDPLITIDQTGQNGAQPSLYIVGGYTFGRSGVSDVIKYVNGTTGTTPYVSVNNFYVQDYANAVNDVVNGRTTAAANMNKVPFYYGPTGGFLSGQAFTLDLNTFVQSPHSGNGILTEIFGTTSSNETVVAASGASTDLSVGGIGFRMPNRAIYGQSPELFAKMTYAFPGGIPNLQQWEFIPAKVGGDNSTRWLGDPGYRWDEIYSADVNTTTATVGTLNVTTCNGCGTGTRLVSGTMQGATATLTGNSADQTIYTATLPAGTFTAGGGARCFAKWTHPTASGAITYKWTLGTTTWAYGAYTSASLNLASDIEVLTIASLSSQATNLSPVIAGTAVGIGGSYGNAGSENLANADTIKLTFNGGSSDQVRGATFYCQTIQ